MRVPDYTSDIQIGGSSHGTGIQNYEISAIALTHSLATPVFEGSLYSCAVGLRRAASEALHKNIHPELLSLLTYWYLPARSGNRWRSLRGARGKSGLHRAACRLTAGGSRLKRAPRKVPQKIYRPPVHRRVR